MKLLFFFLLILVLLQACAHPEYFRGPNGRDAFSVSCRRMENCYRQVAEACPHGYDVITHAVSGSMAIPMGKIWVSHSEHSLAVECKD